MENAINTAAKMLLTSKHTTVLTGAGISVESNIPPFRGTGGIWCKYDPKIFELSYFYSNPRKTWEVIKEIFYDSFQKAKPNEAHYILAKMEAKGLLNCIITQNIDNLHQEAGSKIVYEFHGNLQVLICLNCSAKYSAKKIDFSNIPPKCNKCEEVLKPDFVFFGESIPEFVSAKSFEEAKKAEILLVIGTTGTVAPASMIPGIARQNGAKIIEINTEPSNFTNRITDIYLQGKASEVMSIIGDVIFK